MSNVRIPPAEMSGIQGALATRISRRRLGQVPESLGVMWHHRGVLKTMFATGRKAEKWDACDESLKAYAHMAVSSLVGCSFCLDLGYIHARDENLDLDKARAVPRWRESKLFTPLERDALEYAEAMSQTPPTVTDELSARLLDALGPPGLLELTAYVALANMATRANAALGVEANGLAASCGLPPLEQRSRSLASVA